MFPWEGLLIISPSTNKQLTPKCSNIMRIFSRNTWLHIGDFHLQMSWRLWWWASFSFLFLSSSALCGFSVCGCWLAKRRNHSVLWLMLKGLKERQHPPPPPPPHHAVFSFPSGSFASSGPVGPGASPPGSCEGPWRRPEPRRPCRRRSAVRSTGRWPRGRRSSPWRPFSCRAASGQSSETVKRQQDERAENRMRVKVD